MEIYNKIQFKHISYQEDCLAADRTIVNNLNKETFVDGYKFAFDDTARKCMRTVRCEFRSSLDGKFAVFFFQERSPRVSYFVCDANLRALLMKVYDIAFTE